MPHRSTRSSPAVPRQSLRESCLVTEYHPDISLSRVREPDRFEVADGILRFPIVERENVSKRLASGVLERRRFLCSSPRDSQGKVTLEAEQQRDVAPRAFTRLKIRSGFRSWGQRATGAGRSCRLSRTLCRNHRAMHSSRRTRGSRNRARFRRGSWRSRLH